MLQHIVLISYCLLAIGDSTDLLLLMLSTSLNLVAVDLMTAQPFTDTVTLQPVLPASGLSTCPGQDVTLNCTAIRTLNTLSVDIDFPTMSWVYRIIFTIRSDGTSSSNSPDDIFTAVFHAVNYTVISNATVLSVPLSHHNSEMRCQTSQIIVTKHITIAGI